MKTAKLFSAFCAVILMISLFALPVLAADGNAANAADKNKGIDAGTLVWIIVGAVLLIVAVVLCIKFRSKIAKALRVYKSEFKKVSWLSWEQTRKSTLIVLGVLVICTIVICLLDIGLSEAISWLILDAFKPAAAIVG